MSWAFSTGSASTTSAFFALAQAFLKCAVTSFEPATHARVSLCELLTNQRRSSKLGALKSTSTAPMPSKKPMTVTAVRKGFSAARRKALQTQGAVTIQRVHANQATMKSVP